MAVKGCIYTKPLSCENAVSRSHHAERTDAYNPMADKKLSLEDFVSMCQYQVRSPTGSSQGPH